MRTLKFEFIMGYPDKMNQDEMLDKMVKIRNEFYKTMDNLNSNYQKKDIKVYCDDIEECEDQVRMTCYVQKYTKKWSWNNIMHFINKIKAPYYTYCEMSDFRLKGE